MARFFDETQLLERVDHDLPFLGETIQMLAADGPTLIDQLRGALAAGDAPGVARAAHAIKGMVSNFCASETQSCALEVERIGKGGDLSAAPAAVDALGRQLGALTDELVQFTKARE